MRHWLKSGLKDLQFGFAANYRSLYKIYLKLLYKPRPDTFADLLDTYSKAVHPVHFFQVGANDGFFHDPLFKFINLYGWKGVLLEPQPYVFNKYLSRLYRNSATIIPVNAALAGTDGKLKMFKIAFSSSRWATGLTSFSRQVIQDGIASGHVARMARRYGEKLPDNADAFIDEVEIEALTPETLMARCQIGKIDWLQIDAEGFDFEAIKLMNIEKFQPNVIAFESTHFSAADKNECENLLKRNGYTLTQLGENTVAMKNPNGPFARFFKIRP
jgi:FkbM family methyltransferase